MSQENDIFGGEEPNIHANLLACLDEEFSGKAFLNSKNKNWNRKTAFSSLDASSGGDEESSVLSASASTPCIADINGHTSFKVSSCSLSDQNKFIRSYSLRSAKSLIQHRPSSSLYHSEFTRSKSLRSPQNQSAQREARRKSEGSSSQTLSFSTSSKQNCYKLETSQRNPTFISRNLFSWISKDSDSKNSHRGASKSFSLKANESLLLRRNTCPESDSNDSSVSTRLLSEASDIACCSDKEDLSSTDILTDLHQIPVNNFVKSSNVVNSYFPCTCASSNSFTAQNFTCAHSNSVSDSYKDQCSSVQFQSNNNDLSSTGRNSSFSEKEYSQIPGSLSACSAIPHFTHSGVNPNPSCRANNSSRNMSDELCSTNCDMDHSLTCTGSSNVVACCASGSPVGSFSSVPCSFESRICRNSFANTSTVQTFTTPVNNCSGAVALSKSSTTTSTNTSSSSKWWFFGKSYQKKSAVSSLPAAGSVGLIMEARPSCLPEKSNAERKQHQQQHEQLLEQHRRRQQQLEQQRQKQHAIRLQQEAETAVATAAWAEDLIPNWTTRKSSRKCRDLVWKGIPSCVRGKVWCLTVGNQLNISPHLYNLLLDLDRTESQVGQQTDLKSCTESTNISEYKTESGFSTISTSPGGIPNGFYTLSSPHNEAEKHVSYPYVNQSFAYADSCCSVMSSGSVCNAEPVMLAYSSGVNSHSIASTFSNSAGKGDDSCALLGNLSLSSSNSQRQFDAHSPFYTDTNLSTPFPLNNSDHKLCHSSALTSVPSCSSSVQYTNKVDVREINSVPSYLTSDCSSSSTGHYWPPPSCNLASSTVAVYDSHETMSPGFTPVRTPHNIYQFEKMPSHIDNPPDVLSNIKIANKVSDVCTSCYTHLPGYYDSDSSQSYPIIHHPTSTGCERYNDGVTSTCVTGNSFTCSSSNTANNSSVINARSINERVCSVTHNPTYRTSDSKDSREIIISKFRNIEETAPRDDTGTISREGVRTSPRAETTRRNDTRPKTGWSSWQEVAASEDCINLDVSRTFPHLCIFQEGGPYHDALRNLLHCYVRCRPDQGYVQGMSFLAAVLLLNMTEQQAFIAFANLLNRPLLQVFYSLNRKKLAAYYRTFTSLLQTMLPCLSTHLLQHEVTPDLYLLDWVLTLYTRCLPLDVAVNIWDLYVISAEDEFIFRAAIGILKLHERHLLSLDCTTTLAQFLTRLPQDITWSRLGDIIRSRVAMPTGRRGFAALLLKHEQEIRSTSCV